MALADNQVMNKHLLTISCALVTTAIGATLAVGVQPAAAADPPPPTLNCLTNVCTILHNDAQDSDGDGFSDADEKLFGSDPNDATSCPPVRWMFDRIADGTLPGVWIEPMIDLVTISPDGHVVTETLIDALGSLGLTVPKESDNFGLTMAPAGIDLGTLGGTLNWQVHGESTTKNPPPPDAPDASLYGFTGTPPSQAAVGVDSPDGSTTGTVYVQNTFDFGTFISNAQFVDANNKTLGSGTGKGSDPWQAQADAVKEATKKATELQQQRIAAQVLAETTRLQQEADKLAAEQAAAQKAAKEQAAKDAAAKKAAEEAEAAAKKAAEEAKKKSEAEKDHKGLTDPDAGTPIDVQSLSKAQVAALVAAGTGSYFSNVGDTGVIAMFTPGDYKDPTIFIVHLDPAADSTSEGGANSTPAVGGQAGPDYDPNLPTPGTTGAPVRPPGEPPR
jgi:hypothetical protein